MSKIVETLLSEIKGLEDYEIKFDALISYPMHCKKCDNITEIEKIGKIYSCKKDGDGLFIQCSNCWALYICKCGAVIAKSKNNVHLHFKTKKHQDFLMSSLNA